MPRVITDHCQSRSGAVKRSRSHFHLFCCILADGIPSHLASEPNTKMGVIGRPNGKGDIGCNCTLLFPAVMISSIGPDANRCRTSLSVSSNGAGTKGPLKNCWIAHRCCLTERDSPKYDITARMPAKPSLARGVSLTVVLAPSRKSCTFFSTSCEG